LRASPVFQTLSKEETGARLPMKKKAKNERKTCVAPLKKGKKRQTTTGSQGGQKFKHLVRERFYLVHQSGKREPIEIPGEGKYSRTLQGSTDTTMGGDREYDWSSPKSRPQGGVTGQENFQPITGKNNII